MKMLTNRLLRAIGSVFAACALVVAFTWWAPAVAYAQDAGSMTSFADFMDTTPGGAWIGQLMVSLFSSGLMLFMFRFSPVGLTALGVRFLTRRTG